MLVYTIFHEETVMNRPLYRLLKMIAVLFFFLPLTLGCSYRRLDRCPCMHPWLIRGETVRVDNFRNNTHKLGIEDFFRKALENRIVAVSPWKLQPSTSPFGARWIIQATIESYMVRPLGITSYKGFGHGSSSTAAVSTSIFDVTVTASVRLLDGITGEAVVVRPELTFLRQYKADLNFSNFYNQELCIMDAMADDFAESFLMQILEGSS